MPMKKMVTMLMALCAVGILTGCGVKKDVHNAVLADLNAAKDTNEAHEAKITELNSQLKEANGKARTADAALDAANKQMAELKDQQAEAAQMLETANSEIENLNKQLDSARSATDAARKRTGDVQGQLAQLQAEYDELMNRFEQLRKNMLSLNGDASFDSELAPMTDDSVTDGADAASAMDLLDEMSNQ